MKYAIALLLLLPALATAQAPIKTTGAFVALSVSDLDATVRWYQDKLGLKVTLQPPAHEGVRAVVLEGGGLIVELIHNPAAVPLSTAAPAIQHTTLVHGIFKAGIIVLDYDDVLATLRARQVPIVIGPFPAREGQRANFIIRDNAGNLLQFFEALPGND